jgi:hypothetical protein
MNLNTYALFGFLLGCLALPTGCSPPHAVPERLSERELPYFFSHSPYIHPKIIEDLYTLISDWGDQVIEINLLTSQGRNRYFGDFSADKVPSGPFPLVRWEDSDTGESFGYRYIGETTSGIHVLRTAWNGGGSGTFVKLLFLSVHRDKGASFAWNDEPPSAAASRLVLRKEGEYGLGDRWEGTLHVVGNKVVIGKDQGWFSQSMPTDGGILSIIVDGQQGN